EQGRQQMQGVNEQSRSQDPMRAYTIEEIAGMCLWPMLFPQQESYQRVLHVYPSGLNKAMEYFYHHYMAPNFEAKTALSRKLAESAASKGISLTGFTKQLLASLRELPENP